MMEHICGERKIFSLARGGKVTKPHSLNERLHDTVDVEELLQPREDNSVGEVLILNCSKI